MMMMHQMLHGSSTRARAHPGRQQRRLLLETGMHTGLHRFVQTEHHCLSSHADLRPDSTQEIKRENFNRLEVSRLVLETPRRLRRRQRFPER